MNENQVFNMLLKEFDISGYKISKLTKIAQSTISDYQTGKTKPESIPFGNIVKISKALEIDLNEIKNYLNIEDE